MNLGLQIYWGGLAILYLVLSVQTFRWYRKLRKLERESEIVVLIDDTLRVEDPQDVPDDHQGISITGVFRSITIIDFIGFGLAFLGALLTAFGV